MTGVRIVATHNSTTTLAGSTIGWYVVTFYAKHRTGAASFAIFIVVELHYLA